MAWILTNFIEPAKAVALRHAMQPHLGALTHNADANLALAAMLDGTPALQPALLNNRARWVLALVPHIVRRLTGPVGTQELRARARLLSPGLPQRRRRPVGPNRRQQAHRQTPRYCDSRRPQLTTRTNAVALLPRSVFLATSTSSKSARGPSVSAESISQ
jgi:hypothetical protein